MSCPLPGFSLPAHPGAGDLNTQAHAYHPQEMWMLGGEGSDRVGAEQAWDGGEEGCAGGDVGGGGGGV